ncbi:MAG: membrane protein insertion efficiency factor YidD [Deltaproteobacteria bacterium]|nr:membrane protein insertion efficiency factor YidD [Deltaproteobacteria bacterium]
MSIFTWPILIYQRLISPWIGPCCRFEPSCSEYARQAFVKHNAFFACYLTLKRLLKCQPFSEGGFDPVPEKKDESIAKRACPDHRC